MRSRGNPLRYSRGIQPTSTTTTAQAGSVRAFTSGGWISDTLVYTWTFTEPNDGGTTLALPTSLESCVDCYFYLQEDNCQSFLCANDYITSELFTLVRPCAPLCPIYSVGDTICHQDCNTAACEWDGGRLRTTGLRNRLPGHATERRHMPGRVQRLCMRVGRRRLHWWCAVPHYSTVGVRRCQSASEPVLHQHVPVWLRVVHVGHGAHVLHVSNELDAAAMPRAGASDNDYDDVNDWRSNDDVHDYDIHDVDDWYSYDVNDVDSVHCVDIVHSYNVDNYRRRE